MFGERVALFANAARTSAPNFGYLDENGKELTDSWRTDQMEFGFRVSPVDKVWFSASWFDIIQNNTPVAIDGYTNRYYSDGSKRAEGVELSLNGNNQELEFLSFLHLHPYQEPDHRGSVSHDCSECSGPLAEVSH